MRLKVTLYLSSGDRFTFKCKNFEMTKLTETKGARSARWEGVNAIISLDINEIIAVKVKKVLF